MVTLESQSPTHPPTKTVDTLPSPTGLCIWHFDLPHNSVLVGVPKHSPRSPSHVRALCLIPPEQVLEQEENELQELHFFRLPLLHNLVDRHTVTSELSPTQVLTLRGTPLKTTLFAVLGDEQLLFLDLFPFPQVTEQELQLPHLLQLSSSADQYLQQFFFGKLSPTFASVRVASLGLNILARATTPLAACPYTHFLSSST